MKKLSITTFIIAFFSLTIILSAGSPIMKFKETTIDFGDVDAGKSIDLKFEFENSGDDVLVIKNIRSTCGCTVAKVDKKEYKPGEKGEIPVKFFSRGYRGKITKTVTVTTNDKDNIYTVLKITGNVNLKDFAQAELTPDKLNFEEIKLNTKTQKTFKIKNAGTIDLRIIEVTHGPEVTVEFTKKLIKPKEETDVVVTLNAMDAGKFTSFIKIRTNAYRQYLTILKAEADIKGKEGKVKDK